MTGSSTERPRVGDWHTVLAYALTGAWLELPPVEAADPDRLLTELAARQWSGERLTAAAAVHRPLSAELIRPLGPARFTAVLSEVRQRVLAVETRRVRDRALTSEEHRLSSDRPPHWG